MLNDKTANVKANKSAKVISDHVDTVILCWHETKLIYFYKLLKDLRIGNPEVFGYQSLKLNVVDSPQSNLENVTKHQILEQNTIENDLFENHHCLKISHSKIVDKYGKLSKSQCLFSYRKHRSSVPYLSPPDTITPSSKFYFCRQILTQLGFLSWMRRSSIDLIQKENIFRHLKNIDQLRGFDVHSANFLTVNLLDERHIK